MIRLLSDAMSYYSERKSTRDSTIWVFGASRGRRFSENAKYLFIYLNHNTDIRAVWISKSQSTVDEINTLGYEAYLEGSAEAIDCARGARVAVFTHRGSQSLADLPFQLLSPATLMVQLWHGTPLKKIGYDDKKFSFIHDETRLSWKLSSLVKRRLFPFLEFPNRIDFIPAPSEEIANILTKAFRIDPQKAGITGYPRNDQLNAETRRGWKKELTRAVYMPTFRGQENTSLGDNHLFGLNIPSMENNLSEIKMKLDIKLHPFNTVGNSVHNEVDSSSNINFLMTDDIYDVLHNYDILITDYSSVYFDFLLLDRPIIFAPFDLETYLKKDREFYFDYTDITPGPRCTSWGQIMEELRAFQLDPSRYSDQRAVISKRFNRWRDGRNSERVYQNIVELLDDTSS